MIMMVSPFAKERRAKTVRVERDIAKEEEGFRRLKRRKKTGK